MKTSFSYNQIRSDIKNNHINCVSLVDNYLKVIEDQNPIINAFVEVFSRNAMKQAQLVDQKILKGEAGKLAGMVIGIKDNICIKDQELTAASKILSGFKSLYNSTVVDRLISEDAIIIGRLNCDEFAMGSSNENSSYGLVRNPHNIEKVAGGSSGGSAAAVASGMCFAALGSDTGGSIRQPAAFCGLVGIKPTYSRVSRYGLIAYASSFDQIGTLTHTIEDGGLIMEVISGKDPKDSTSSLEKVDKYSKIEKRINNKRVAVLNDCMERSGVDQEIKDNIEETILLLQEKGHFVERISFPYLDYLVPAYYVLTTAEASSNLSRYDGIHYGYRSHNTDNLEETYYKSRSEGFGDEVKRRIMLGTFVLSSGYQEAYYKKAQQIRRIIYDQTNQILKEYDFLLSPTTPHTAFDIGSKVKDPVNMYLEDIFTVHANITGKPAITIPAYKHSNGLPLGLQLLGEDFKEKEIFDFASQILNLHK